ncbi:hypothetical protein IC582_015161 [Cucumis melo]
MQPMQNSLLVLNIIQTVTCSNKVLVVDETETGRRWACSPFCLLRR